MQLYEVLQGKFNGLGKEVLRTVILAIEPWSGGLEWFDDKFSAIDNTIPIQYLSWLGAPFLANANLTDADLRYAYLYNANLTSANLYNAYLYNANLANADLANANLRYADLRYAYLYNANLYNANLYNATYNKYTRWPAEFDPASAGCILEE